MLFLGRKERLSPSNPSKSTLLVQFVSYCAAWNFNMLSAACGDFFEHCTVQPWDQSWEDCGISMLQTSRIPKRLFLQLWSQLPMIN